MTLRTVASRLASAPSRTRALVACAAGAAALLLATADDPLLATAGRGALAALALAAIAWRVRRGDPVEPPSRIAVSERRSLSRDAAVALLRVGGRTLLVGHGPDGVRLLADLGADGEGTP